MNLKVALQMHRVRINSIQSEHHLPGFALHILILSDILIIAPKCEPNVPQSNSYKDLDYLNLYNVYLFNEECEKYPKHAQSCHFAVSQRMHRLPIGSELPIEFK